MDCGTSVKVAVRIRPLGHEEKFEDAQHCLNIIPGVSQIIAGTDTFFTFDHVFGVDSTQSSIYDDCVADLVNAAFEGFNATILAYGQTGSGKTWTMGSGTTDMRLGSDSFGIIPRVIKSLFDIIQQKEEDEPNSSYKVHIQFLELYGEDIKDLLEHTKTSKVTIRETATGDVFVSGAREETVNSASQMMRALEDGSRHRTTASTLMNSSSSRSHAIFTVFLEHTIESTVLGRSGGMPECDDLSVPETKSDEDLDTVSVANTENFAVSHSKEVRKCKFHFVDLAGSERAKRTGAQGVQMKEGIDINKGLLALGNVISALGDESRKGKVHVPYRVSKLTRMLQDSLGGNSKTLMICCVSPAEVNFHESLNALRYANRARNIKNKPRVNRDPTLVLVAELKLLVQTLATELIDVRKHSLTGLPDNVTSLFDLELILRNSSEFKPKALPPASSRPPSLKFTGLALRCDDDTLPQALSGRLSGRQSSRTSFNSTAGPPSAQPTPSKDAAAFASAKREHAREVALLKNRSSESEGEIKRLADKLKAARVKEAEQAETIVLVGSERDFYRMKWSDVSPEEAFDLTETSTAGGLFETLDDSPGDEGVRGEKSRVTALSARYLREIQALKIEIAEQRQLLAHGANLAPFDIADSVLESDLSTNVARVIAQTERHLLLEAKRLKSIGVGVNGETSISSVLSSLDDGNDSDDSAEVGAANGGAGSDENVLGQGVGESRIEENDLAYQRRQKVMVEEVAELGESIELKEQLLGQLKRSHYQYGIMKAFYEKKLSDLNEEMDEKQEERDMLKEELSELEKASKQEEKSMKTQSAKEKLLREQLEKRDDELKLMKKRQEELSNLSRVQSRYMTQVSKLESDIISMRRQKVNLSKNLQDEKKKHFTLLNDKAREIDKLKRDLMKSTGEAKRLGVDKLKAEERAKEAMRVTAAMRKKTAETQRFGAGPGSSDSGKVKSKVLRRPSQVNIQILNESELKTKKWLDSKIADINARDETVITLRKQLEQQMLLLNTKEALEIERHAMKCQILRGQETGERMTHEEEESYQEVEDRLESVEGQLKLRDRNISEIEIKLGMEGEGAAVQERTLDALKKMAAGTLPTSHDLINLMFSMLVSTKSTSKQRKTALQRTEVREKQLRCDLDDAVERMHSLARAHDKELTRSANEYEEKLLGLFTHSTIGQIVTKESGIMPVEIADFIQSPIESIGSDDSPFETSRQGSFSTQGGNSFYGKSTHTLEVEASRTVLLAAATEQCGLLKGRLEREGKRSKELQTRISELSHSNMLCKEEIKEKNVNIKFLEDESNLFRDMASKLRAGVLTLGGNTGAVILDQVKGGRKFNGNANRAGTMNPDVRHGGWDSEGDDDDDDDENLRGEFMNLGDEITRTGTATGKSAPSPEARGNSPMTSPRPVVARPPPSSITSGGSRDVVYDRLTNPSNFTGAMKSAFGQDLQKKRQLVQMIKNGQPYNNSGYALVVPKTESTISRSNSNVSKEGGSRRTTLSSGRSTPTGPKGPTGLSPPSTSTHGSETVSANSPSRSRLPGPTTVRRAHLSKQGAVMSPVNVTDELLPVNFSDKPPLSGRYYPTHTGAQLQSAPPSHTDIESAIMQMAELKVDQDQDEGDPSSQRSSMWQTRGQPWEHIPPPAVPIRSLLSSTKSDPQEDGSQKGPPGMLITENLDRNIGIEEGMSNERDDVESIDYPEEGEGEGGGYNRTVEESEGSRTSRDSLSPFNSAESNRKSLFGMSSHSTNHYKL